jgi:predicted DCC family thiol-disulfide oxidoreductase YuxK
MVHQEVDMEISTFNPGKLQVPVTVIYDSTNAASVHEVKFLESRNKGGKLEFVDLAGSTGAAGDYGLDAEAVAEQLYARDASGQLFVGTDALYAAHAAIGLTHWFEMARLPGFLCVGTGIGPKP